MGGSDVTFSIDSQSEKNTSRRNNHYVGQNPPLLFQHRPCINEKEIKRILANTLLWRETISLRITFRS